MKRLNNFTAIFSLLLLNGFAAVISEEGCGHDHGHNDDDSHNHEHGPHGHESKSLWSKPVSEDRDSEITINAIAKLDGYKMCTENCYDQQWKNDFKIWDKSEKITENDFKGAMKRASYPVKYQIIDGKLFRGGGRDGKGRCTFQMRCEGIEYMLNRVIKKYGSKLKKNIEFALNDFDHPQISYGEKLPIFSFSKPKGNKYSDIIYPCWAFWAGGPCVKTEPDCLGRWDLKIKTLGKKANEFPWEKKKNVAFFRGSRTSSERDPLIQLSVKYPELVEARYVKNQAWKSDADTLHLPPAEEIPLEDHCQYKYLFNFRGVAASFRFRHLFLCNSLVFHVGNEWIEFHYVGMKPWVHYIPVKQDLSDAEELIQWAMKNDDIAKIIAKNGNEMVLNNLKLTDVRDYWYQVLYKYSSLTDWEAKLDTDAVAVPANIP